MKDDPAKEESGYHGWQLLHSWYMDPNVEKVMAAHYTKKLDALLLDNDSTATEFINSFESYVKKIEKFEGTKWKESKIFQEFKKMFFSDDYDTEKRLFCGATLEMFM